MRRLCVIFGLLFALSPVSYAQDSKSNLKILTLNTWALRILGHPIGKDIPERLKLIPAAISATGADLVALQEVWPNRYLKSIAAAFETLGYRYSVFHKRKLGMGNGLLLLSKYPIVSSAVSPIFRKHTRLDEHLAGKRALYAEIEISETQRVDFFTVHMGALSYDKQTGAYKPGQKRRQLAQYLEFKSWFQRTRKNPISIVAGDFNADYRPLRNGKFLPEYDTDYLSLIDRTCGANENWLDTFLSANQMNASSPSQPTFSSENPYVAAGLFADAPSETEDYIFSCGLTSEQIQNSEVIFDKPLKNTAHPQRLSDHFGLITEVFF